MAKRSYWRLRLNGEHHGLTRRTFTDEGGYAGLAYLGEEGWVEDRTLLRWWLDPGDRDLIEVSREEAQRVASAAGVELDGPAGTLQIGASGPEPSAAPEERQDSARASETAEALRRSPYARLVEHRGLGCSSSPARACGQ